VDGEIGPLTIAAAAKADPASLVGKICDQRLAFLKGLGTWRTFGNGWTRRVEGVRKPPVAAVASDQIEYRKSVVVADDGFGVDHEGEASRRVAVRLGRDRRILRAANYEGFR
jgi:lysozyme family protein